MRRIITVLFILLSFNKINAQATETENYIQTRTYLEPVTLSSSTAKQIQTVEYFDGLGRPKQTVHVKSTPLGRDLVKYFKYDDFGRPIYNYLPVPQSDTNSGAIVDNPLNNASQPHIYGNEKIFAVTTLEKSPFDRILEQKQVGNQWNDKPVKFEYAANDTGEVKKYTATFNYSSFTSTISLSGTYGGGQLFKDIVSDEDGNKTIKYTNGQGQVLMVRKVISTSENADTYYVYNNYDQLAYIVTPVAASGNSLDDNIINNLCYQYKYDKQNRLVEKKFPGKGWEFIIYDKQDRVILTQDAMLGTTTNSFNKKGWLFTKYDRYGRIVYTGFFANTASRTTLQTAVNNMSLNSSNNELRSADPFTLNGIDVYYTKNAFPTGSMTILSVNYYDTYPVLASEITIPTDIINQPLLSDDHSVPYNTNKLIVATYLKNIEDDKWTKQYFWYDQKGRLIGEHSVNHLGGYTKVDTELDFYGITKQIVTKHKRLLADTEKLIKETFEYDDQNRLKTHKHQVDNNPVELLSQSDYNELSQLSNKKVGGTITGEGIQSLDYKYNIRGWLTQVNDPTSLNGKLFGYSLKYANPTYSNVVSGKYNGNITEIDWMASTDGIQKRYNYEYDGLNRLLKGEYSEPESSLIQNHYFDESLTYDQNGNIKTLKRFSKPSVGTIAEKIDDLIYNYDNNDFSNKLSKIILPANEPNNSWGYNALGNIFEYDLNGNVIKNLDKGIYSIKYNYLNQITNIVQDAGHVTSNYIYQANGNKVTRYEEFPLILRYRKITDYLDGFQYETIGTGPDFNTNAVLKFRPTSEGYFDYEKNVYNYEYKDHLGNIRLTYNRNNNGINIIEQKNFYPFGLDHAKYFFNQAENILPEYAYAYNNKEYQALTGMYDYGARMYMPDIGRWGTIDPRTQYTHETYSYVWNNPITFNDPTGMSGLAFAFPSRNGRSDGEVWQDSDGMFYWDKTRGVWRDFKDGSSVITQVTLKGKSKNSNSGPASLAMTALYVSQADSPAPGPGDVAAVAMLVGAGIWWTYNQFAPPSTGYTTIADPGAGYRSLNSESETATEEDKDVNEITIPDEHKIPRDSLDPPTKPGNAPKFKKDGKSVEIHHEDQKAEGPFKEMHPHDHRGKGNYSKNHPKGNKPLSKEERSKFNTARQNYWKKEYPDVK